MRSPGHVGAAFFVAPVDAVSPNSRLLKNQLPAPISTFFQPMVPKFRQKRMPLCMGSNFAQIFQLSRPCEIRSIIHMIS